MTRGLILKKLKPSLYIFYSAVILGGIALDQLTKWLAVEFLSHIITCPLIEGVLHLTYVENEGAAFGMLADKPWIFITVSSVTIAVLAFLLYAGRFSNLLYSVSISLIISGGIGNMIDRLANGYVVDFVDFRLINFAVFNTADIFVCVGAGLLILALILDIVKEYQKSKQDSKE